MKALRDRSKQWGLDKNIKQHEKKVIAQHLSIRDTANKRSDIRVRGKSVSLTKLARIRKHNHAASHIEIPRFKSLTQLGIEIVTPPASPLTTPRLMGIPEKITKYITDYISAAFEAKIWVSLGDAESLQASPAVFLDVTLQLALNQITSGKGEDAEQTLQEAMSCIEYAVKNQADGLLLQLFASLYRYASLGEIRRIMPVLEKCAAIARNLLRSTYQLTLVTSLTVSYLRESESCTILPALSAAWMSLVNGFKNALGPFHKVSLSYQRSYIEGVAVSSGDRGKAVSEMRKIVRSCDNEFHSPVDLRNLGARFTLLSVLTCPWSQQYAEAAQIAYDIIERTQRQEFPPEWVKPFRRAAQFRLGWCQVELGRVDSGISHMREALDIPVRGCNASSATYKNYRRQFEHSLRRWGRMVDAVPIDVGANSAR